MSEHWGPVRFYRESRAYMKGEPGFWRGLPKAWLHFARAQRIDEATS